MGMWILRIWYWVEDMKEKYLKEMQKRHSVILCLNMIVILFCYAVVTNAYWFFVAGNIFQGIVCVSGSLLLAIYAARRIGRANKIQYDLEIVIHRIAFGEDEEVKENEKVSDIEG